MVILLFLLVAALLCEAIVVWMFISDLQAQRKNEATPVVSIDSLGDADVNRTVAVEGALVTDKPLASPATGKDLAWYRLYVYHSRKGARYHTKYTDVNDCRAAACSITDDSGASLRLGNLANAEVVLDNMDHVTSRDTEDAHTDLLPRLIAHYDDVALENKWKPDRHLTFKERGLPPGADVYVRGVLRRDQDGLVLDANEAAGCPQLWLSDLRKSAQGGHFGFMRVVYVVGFIVIGLFILALLLGVVAKLTDGGESTGQKRADMVGHADRQVVVSERVEMDAIGLVPFRHVRHDEAVQVVGRDPAC